jgi:N-acetylmuramoyl-L-alanine amidase
MWLPHHWIAKKPTTHFSARKSSINAIILHYTAGGHYSGTVSWFLDSRTSASSHFVIGREGEIVQMVRLSDRAHHAGDGEMLRDGELLNPNDFSIGIEIANFGLLDYSGSNFFYSYDGVTRSMYDVVKYGPPRFANITYYDGMRIHGAWERYKQKQIKSVTKLCKLLIDTYHIPLDRIVGHSDTALPLGRKKDPGPLWPWDTFLADLGGKYNPQNLYYRSL